ncbi:hypothetical protein JUJ52_03285 [Virgibacillus sp. AGTR]|uniref:hypothetical protein n=1 Tax=Virgibacillus sp. AGTR TaxID=2812055 RepID=UPI001D16ECF7|nr:hypothetical protein [Virgibacillus sp. AGTR]MCC2248981.1 hypothetical protein [Virgibacillus sp. AGTR]
MGLFTKHGSNKSKKNKPSDVKPTKKDKKSKEKKSLFSGKKKELTLLERMQLEESVAAASLDVVQELAEIGNSAVRELDDGLLIVAVTNEMLEEAGLDHTGEEFGSFAQALRSETIESITLADDLATGVIGIIPSQETLISLDEFDFVHDLAFCWALVPFDLSDDDRLTVLESTVHIERLVEMANDPNIQLDIKNGEIVEAEVDEGYGETNAETYAPVTDGLDEGDNFEEDNGMDFDEDNSLVDRADELGTNDLNELEDSEDLFDEEPDTDFDNTDMDAELDDMLDANLDNGYDDTFDESDMYEGYDSDMEDMEDVAVATDFTEDDGMTAEESKESINRLVFHGFNNTELDLNIDMSKFDDYFDSVSIARFDTSRTDGSELQNVLSKLREDANVELQRFHQDNIQSLRNKFTTSMRDIHNKLVESLDHKDKQTPYGRRHDEIESEFEEAMDDLERQVAGEIARINKEYNDAREEYAENAKREAYAVYDSRYRDERNQKIDNVRDHVQSDLKTNRDTELGELYKDRRTVAKRLFDKAMTGLLQQLQEEYQAISQKELQMYDAFRKNMDSYLRKHFADEVLRAKAEAEKLKQSHEAERVRAEYEQMLLTKTRQIEEDNKQARENLRQVESKLKEQIDRVIEDYERRIEREHRENENLRELLQNANASNSKIGEQKEEEVKHRMKMYEDALEAKEKELAYANERANQAHRPMKFVLGAVGAVTLAIGIIFGFLFGANSIEIAPASNEAQPTEQTVPFNNEIPAEVMEPFNVHIAV